MHDLRPCVVVFALCSILKAVALKCGLWQYLEGSSVHLWSMIRLLLNVQASYASPS